MQTYKIFILHHSTGMVLLESTDSQALEDVVSQIRTMIEFKETAQTLALTEGVCGYTLSKFGGRDRAAFIWIADYLGINGWEPFDTAYTPVYGTVLYFRSSGDANRHYERTNLDSYSDPKEQRTRRLN